jgi:molybdopterin converting factor small subunit
MVNKREEELEVSSKASIHELLRKLSSLYGKVFEDEVLQDDGENLGDGMTITVNGIAIRQLDGMSTRLKMGDTIALLPLFLGGG